MVDEGFLMGLMINETIDGRGVFDDGNLMENGV